jgi:hypothetical protein
MVESGSTSESFQAGGCTSGITKGRCYTCNIVWYWKTGTRKLRNTACPRCGHDLHQTTHLTKSAEWRELPRDGVNWNKLKQVIGYPVKKA